MRGKMRELENHVPEINQRLFQHTYNNLDARIEVSEHNERAKCIELNGIDFSKGENCMEALDKILKHLELSTITPSQDIDKIYRIKQSKRIVVKFVHTNKRDVFFNSIAETSWILQNLHPSQNLKFT